MKIRINKTNYLNTLALIILSVFLINITAYSQSNKGAKAGGMSIGSAGPGGSSMAAIKAAFYPPKLVMKHQNDINLTQEQKDKILGIMNGNHATHSKIRWDLQSKVDELNELVSQDEVPLSEASSKLDEIMSMEQQLKQMQLGTLVQIKNILNAEQKERLEAYKSQSRSKGAMRSGKGSKKGGNKSGKRKKRR